MKVHFVCAYYSDLAHKLKKRPEDYWDAYFYVWGVKVGTFRRSFMVHISTGKKQITEKNFSNVRRLFGKFIAKTLEGEDTPVGTLLVPIPSKDGTISASTYRTLDMLTESLANTKYSSDVFDGIRWTAQLPKSHEGGKRDRVFWRQHMKVNRLLKDRNVVLIDDVLSTGSTMLAAKEALEAIGANILGAITCGRTVYNLDTKPFKPQTFELVDEIHEYQNEG